MLEEDWDGMTEDDEEVEKKDNVSDSEWAT